MTAEPNVALTEAERAELELDLHEYWHEADLTGPGMDKMLASIARIKAAARREALLEARERIIADRDAEVVRLDGIEAVQASIPLNNWVYGIAVGAAHVDDVLNDRPARQDRRPHPALADPERDEEGGR